MNRPSDRPFASAIRAEIEQTITMERIVFFDTDNKVREAVYPAEFESGELRRVRHRLEKEGVLKAVVHVSAHVFGAPRGHGPRTSVVEYLPTNQIYGYTYRPGTLQVSDDDTFEVAAQITKGLFENTGREEEEE